MKEVLQSMPELQEVYIIYDSLTGNTKKIVDAVAAQLQEDGLRCLVLKTEEAETFNFIPSNVEKRLYILASWVDRSGFAPKLHKFIQAHTEELSWGKHAFIATAGWVQAPYPDKIMNTMSENFETEVGKLDLVAKFVCQGKMRESTKERYLSGKDRHANSPELIRIKLDNWEHALEHPNLQDLEYARSWVAQIYA